MSAPAPLEAQPSKNRPLHWSAALAGWARCSFSVRMSLEMSFRREPLLNRLRGRRGECIGSINTSYRPDTTSFTGAERPTVPMPTQNPA